MNTYYLLLKIDESKREREKEREKEKKREKWTADRVSWSRQWLVQGRRFKRFTQETLPSFLPSRSYFEVLPNIQKYEAREIRALLCTTWVRVVICLKSVSKITDIWPPFKRRNNDKQRLQAGCRIIQAFCVIEREKRNPSILQSATASSFLPTH